MSRQLSRSGKKTTSLKRIEHGAIIKKGKRLFKVALVYPNTYETGMSSLGFQRVYQIANQLETVSCERVFLPEKAQATSLIRSIEGNRPLDKFDVILFSISFENDFIHLAQLLKASGIPLRSPDRNHTHHPLVVAGGVACFLNPQPIAPFIDIFLIGEAECLLKDFFRFLQSEKNRTHFLNRIEGQLPGAYVPSCHTTKEPFSIPVRILPDLSEITTSSCLFTNDTAFKNLFLIETLKGCPHGCRFCSAGFVYRPARIYSTANIIKALFDAPKNCEKAGLVSSAIADHPQIDTICQAAVDKGLKLSFSSLRADKLSSDLIHALSTSGVKTATIAPEAGSERMRRVINKNIQEHHILRAAKKLVDAGIFNLRLYFMVGLPFETDADALEIVSLTEKIKSVFLEASRKKGKIGHITLSINPFIPKPATPFQWAAMEKQSTLKRRVKKIRDALKAVPNVRVNVESLRQARVHALLSLGDTRCADLIETAMDLGWNRTLQIHKSLFEQIVYDTKKTCDPLPWDFIEHHVSVSYLKNEYKKAAQEKNSPPCPMIDCTRCNLCTRK